MIVNGIRTEKIAIDVSREELFIGLAKELGIYDLFMDDRDSYHKLETTKTSGKTQHTVVRYEDISLHGRPCFKKVSERILTDNEYECAEAMLKIKNIMSKEKMNKIMNDLNI